MSPPDSDSTRFQEATSRVIASTVKVWTESGTGTAFYIGKGQFVTAGHVVANHRIVTVTNAIHEYAAEAQIVGFLPEAAGDLAILAADPLNPPPFPPLEWAGELSPGQAVGLAGYSAGFARADIRGAAAVTQGVVSRVHDEDGITYVQTSAQMNPGDSGGPLFDLRGRVAGVVTSKIKDGEGLGFAVAEPSLGKLIREIREAAVAALSCVASQSVVNPGGATGIVCTVTDVYGEPVAGVEVIPEVIAGHDWFAGAGETLTDERGQTVITFLAPPTRGEATLGGRVGSLRADAEVFVRDPASIAFIEHDAPLRVEPLKPTRITITVLDDEGVRMGSVPIRVDKVDGGGVVDGPREATTLDGRASFSFVAPVSGEAVLRVRAGDERIAQITEIITIFVGPEPRWSDQPTPGICSLVWNGEDGAPPSAGIESGMIAIWQWNAGEQSWVGYFPAADSVPGGNTLHELKTGESYLTCVDREPPPWLPAGPRSPSSLVQALSRLLGSDAWAKGQ